MRHHHQHHDHQDIDPRAMRRALMKRGGQRGRTEDGGGMSPDGTGFGAHEHHGGPRGGRGGGHGERGDRGGRGQRPEGRGRSGFDPDGFDAEGFSPEGFGTGGHDLAGRGPGGRGRPGFGPGGRGPSGRGPGGRDPEGFGPQGFGPDGPDVGPEGHGGRSHGPGFGRGGRGPGRGRGRRPRGDVRTAVLLLLSEEPMHGYQLMQTIGERTGGRWAPSPGAIYPTLSQLEDEGLVETSKQGGRKLATLTETGRSHVEEHRAAWSDPFGTDDTDGQELPDLRVALHDLGGAVREAGRSAGTTELGQIAEVLSETKRSIYRILAGDVSPTQGSDASADENAATATQSEAPEASEASAQADAPESPSA